MAAELVHGARASIRDPVRFAFAHGGKDGTPVPVDRQTYDRTIEVLRGARGRPRVDHSDRSRALKRLAAFGDGLGQKFDKRDDQAGLAEEQRHQPFDDPHFQRSKVGLGGHLATRGGDLAMNPANVGLGRNIREISRPGLGDDVGDRLGLRIGEPCVFETLDDPVGCPSSTSPWRPCNGVAGAAASARPIRP